MKAAKSRVIFNIAAVIILGITAIICALPFVMVISGSLSSNTAIIRDGYSIFPREFSFDAYKMIFAFPKVIGRSYVVSIVITLLGTLIGLVIMTMAGYALQCRQLRYANKISFFIYFTTLFSGGLVPWYMLIVNMGLKNNIMALILPMVANAFHILLIRNFMRQLPESLAESAKIDGAGDFLIFVRIVLPLSLPIVATIALFLGLSYWNNWYLASLFTSDQTLWPLQYKLYRILTDGQAMSSMGAEFFRNAVIPAEPLKLATAVVATGPILLLYPFMQRYFVQGITIGAVKG